MRVKLFTFRYSATLGGFDETPLAEFVRDKEVLAFREHFFSVNETPHLICVLVWQDAVMGAQTDPSKLNFDPQAASDEAPGHEVSVSAFFLSKYEMTQGQ